MKGINEKVPISDLPKGVLKVFEHDDHLSFRKLSFEHIRKVEYCLRMHPSLEYQVWVRDTQLSVTDLLNLFAKNVSSDCNSTIHKKRSGDTMNAKKRTPSTMKKKKLTSS